MRLQTSNSNQPNWHSITVSAELPQQLKPLEELSKNLWWVWNSKGKSLFHDLDPDLWRRYGQNPVMLLQNLSYARLEEILADKAYVDGVLKDGAERAARLANRTVSKVYRKVGLLQLDK